MSCALCGRPMDQAAVQIGEYPVGPKCAQRAGLLELSRRKGGIVFPVLRRSASARRNPQPELELFPEGAVPA